MLHSPNTSETAENGRFSGLHKARNRAKRRAKISIVVASCREPRLLSACLNSLHTQCREHRADIVVARCGNAGELKDLRKMYPSVRFVLTPGHKTIPQLRAYGMAATDADVVALTEDHCIVASNWVSQLLSAFEQGTEVVGGAMDNAQRRRAIDWAAYFAEYGFFAENRDLQALRAPLTAANVAYRRAVVNEVIKWAKQGEWENVIHARLLEQGRSFQFLKTATVYQNKNYRFWDFCRDRFVHGRDYARRRLLDERSRRCTYFVGSFVLPAVLTLRVSQIAAGHHPRPFLRALPFTFAFLTAWSIGETVGYCYGPAGPCTNRT